MAATSAIEPWIGWKQGLGKRWVGEVMIGLATIEIKQAIAIDVALDEAFFFSAKLGVKVGFDA